MSRNRESSKILWIQKVSWNRKMTKSLVITKTCLTRGTERPFRCLDFLRIKWHLRSGLDGDCNLRRSQWQIIWCQIPGGTRRCIGAASNRPPSHSHPAPFYSNLAMHGVANDEKFSETNSWFFLAKNIVLRPVLLNFILGNCEHFLWKMQIHMFTYFIKHHPKN